MRRQWGRAEAAIKTASVKGSRQPVGRYAVKKKRHPNEPYIVITGSIHIH